MKHYDFIFAGGGLSGSMLLYFFLQSRLKGSTFLLIDNKLKQRKSRQWSFWLNKNTPFDHLSTKQWNKFGVNFGVKEQIFSLNNYSISLLESKNFYSFIDNYFSSFTNVDMVEDSIIDLQSNINDAQVKTKKQKYSAEYIFDSTFNYEQKQPLRDLLMEGLTIKVTTPDSHFNPSVMKFMDFRGTPEKELMFYYVLPITEKFAFIDTARITNMSSQSSETYHMQFAHKYITEHLGCKQYSIEHKKFERIPLSEKKIERFDGKRIIRIGAKGGMINPTTSYGFVNILKDNEKIINSFVKTSQPKSFYNRSAVSKQLNSIMTELFIKNPTAVKTMYRELFERNPQSGDSILAYINDELSIFKSISMLTKVNPEPIVRLMQNKIKKSKHFSS